MNRVRQELISWAKALLLAVVLALLLRGLLIEPYQILQTSMETTIHEFERVYVNKLVYRLHPPRRGDVVLVRIPGEARPLIKRVIGEPGDTVEIRDGAVWLNGQQLIEPYLTVTTPGTHAPVIVTPEHLFLLGDNRPVSKDSRNPSVGLVGYDQLIGRAEIVYWPLNQIRLIRK